MNPTRRYRPGRNIYEEPLPEVAFNGDPNQQMPFDCDQCHRKFTIRELTEFAKPFLNRGQQEGSLPCPSCGYQMRVAFAVDSVQ